MTTRFPVFLVRFLTDDPMGLWEKGQQAWDLGQESPQVPVWNFIPVGTGEIISLTSPYERGLVERVESDG
jgi:hypothetical protein